ncbi:hypothetical protein AB6E21_05790 [Photobacterium swingsii]|uniref:hypothetical protein n=1 Tax=Photobacterium swingsii TaxID=680026 RepID=UPI00354CD31F
MLNQVFLGRVTNEYEEMVFIEPITSASEISTFWDQKIDLDDFPSRGKIFTFKNDISGLNQGSFWTFKLSINKNYQSNSSLAKYSAIELKPALRILDFSNISDQESLRVLLTKGTKINGKFINHPPSLFKIGGGGLLRIEPSQLEITDCNLGFTKIKLNNSVLTGSLDVIGFHDFKEERKQLHSEFICQDWLPSSDHRFCWDSDARFLYRMTNRIPKLKKRCEEHGLSLTDAYDITKKKAHEAIEILELSGCISEEHRLNESLLERYNTLTSSLDSNYDLAHQLFLSVYDDESVNKILDKYKQDYLLKKRGEINAEILKEKSILKQAKDECSAITKDISDHTNRLKSVEAELSKAQAQLEADVLEREVALKEEFDAFKLVLETQTFNLLENSKKTIVESILRDSLFSSLITKHNNVHLDQGSNDQLHIVGIANNSKIIENPKNIEGKITSSKELEESLKDLSELLCLKSSTLSKLDFIVRSKEIALLDGESAHWLIQGYSWLLGLKRTFRYTPGPATLSLDDLLFRGGTNAPTALNDFCRKAEKKPKEAYLIILDQVDQTETTFWVPALARELRYGNRIPNNVMIILTAHAKPEFTLDVSKEIWPIHCPKIEFQGKAMIHPSKLHSEPKALSSKFIYPEMEVSSEQAFRSELKEYHQQIDQGIEIWSRIARILETGYCHDKDSIKTLSRYLFDHFKSLL